MSISLENITFHYPGKEIPALDSISCDIKAGELTALVGNNGAGKSTLIRLITGQLLGYEGALQLSGLELDPLKGELMSQISMGYCPDVPVLDPSLTGYEIAQFVSEIRNINSTQFEQQMDLFKSVFQLDTWFYQDVCANYSKGMLKKTSLIIAFIGNIKFVVLDEPFDGLDPITLFQLKKYLTEIIQKGVGILLSSHLLDTVEKIFDHIIFIKSGTLVHQFNRFDFEDPLQKRTSLESLYFELFN